MGLRILRWPGEGLHQDGFRSILGKRACGAAGLRVRVGNPDRRGSELPADGGAMLLGYVDVYS